jgi:prepilin-type N-terminal cleavage/methylation domain-containing protein
MHINHHDIRRGFTLVELIVVIVILGVLAVSAAPKFMDLKKDARVATLNHMKGVIKSVNNMVYGKAIFRGGNTNYTEKSVNQDGSINDGNWIEGCEHNNCVEVGGVWLYLKRAYIDRNSVAYAIDGDVGGVSTKTKDGKKVPDRCTIVNCLNKACSSYKDSDVCDHDICQCRSTDRINGASRDTQHLVLRGTKYRGKCYLGYSSADLVSVNNVATFLEPAYTIVTDDC